MGPSAVISGTRGRDTIISEKDGKSLGWKSDFIRIMKENTSNSIDPTLGLDLSGKDENGCRFASF